MKVKIGDKIYSGKKEPIMIILTKNDKINIKNMLPKATKYCQFPDTYNKKTILKWMDKNEKN